MESVDEHADVAASRAALADAPRSCAAYLDLVAALTALADAEPDPDDRAGQADEPVELLRAAVELADENLPVALARLAALLYWRCTARAEQDAAADDIAADRDEGIAHFGRLWRMAVDADAVPEFVADEFPVVQRVTDLLLQRAQLDRDMRDIDTAVGYASAVLDVLEGPETEPHQAISHYQLAQAHGLREDIRPGTEHDAIAHLRALRDMSPDRHPWHDESAVLLGMQLAQRIARDPGRYGADIDEAMDELRRAEDTLPANVDLAEGRAMLRYWQGTLLVLRHAVLGGDDDDRARAEEILTGIVETGGPTVFVDASRVTLIALRHVGRLPAGLRGTAGTSTPGDWLRQLRETNPDLRLSAAEAAEIDRVVAELSDDFWRNPMTAPIGQWLKVLPIIGTGVTERTPEELARARDLLRDIDMRDDAGNVLMAVMRDTIGVHRADMLRDPDTYREAVDELLATARTVAPDHPMRRVVEDVLAAGMSTRGARPTSADGLSDLVLRLEQVLTELPDDHPDRVRTITDLAITLLRTVPSGKPAIPVGRVRALLAQAIERSATDETTATLMVLLGWCEGMEGVLNDDVALVRRSIERYQRAATLVPPDHQLAIAVHGGLAASLMQRSVMDGSVEDMDAATYYSTLSHPSAGAAGQDAARMLNTVAGYWRNRDRLGADLLDQVVEARADALRYLRLDADSLPAMDATGDFVRPLVGADNELGFPTEGPRLAAFVAAADRLTTALAEREPDSFGYAEDVAMTAMANVGAGFAARDTSKLDIGLRLLSPRCDDTTAPVRRRLRALTIVGGALLMRFMIGRERADIDAAIDRLATARALAGEHPDDIATSDVASLSFQLGQCYMARSDVRRGDRRDAVAAGLAALRARAEDVLLQTGAQRALASAMSATDEAAEVTCWCVESGDATSAVTALEIGRGTVLYAATVDAGLPALLRDGGHPELAQRWEREVSAAGSAPWDLGAAAPVPGGTPIPSDLRRQVFTIIEGTDISSRLFTPPSAADIATALRAAAAEALVYLLPGGGNAPGLAVLVAEDGAVRAEMLPRLHVSPRDRIENFQRAQRNLLTGGGTRDEWSAALLQLCDWAWPAAMGPVLERMIGVRPGTPSRVVLVPVGVLGAVPWHAASRPVATGVRYASQDAIVSYAASARQFVDAVRRGRRPWHERPALARVRDSDLHWDRREMAEIQAHCYPGAPVLGAHGDDDDDADIVRPADVIGLLPGPDGDGASVLHLGCHGNYAPVPVDSSIVLDGDSHLYVRDVLRHARDRPADAPGGLVVLATCVSDLTDNAHDEALTLASAFLAAGGAGVVGTRWPVDDLPTALFMIMFHHYLNFGYPDPATALRATQQWMLNPNRALPPGVSAKLAGPMRRADLAAVRNWAGFTYQGQ